MISVSLVWCFLFVRLSSSGNTCGGKKYASSDQTVIELKLNSKGHCEKHVCMYLCVHMSYLCVTFVWAAGNVKGINLRWSLLFGGGWHKDWLSIQLCCKFNDWPEKKCVHFTALKNIKSAITGFIVLSQRVAAYPLKNVTLNLSYSILSSSFYLCNSVS